MRHAVLRLSGALTFDSAGGRKVRNCSDIAPKAAAGRPVRA